MAEGCALGLGWLSAVEPADLQADYDQWRTADSQAAKECKIRIYRADGAWRWFLMCQVPQLDADGHARRWFGFCTDTDEHHRAEIRQSVLLAEMQHGVNDILATVRSVLARTLQTSADPSHFSSHVAGRIGALARTYSVAGRNVDRTVMVEDLIYNELNSHGASICEQVSVEGPPVALRDRVAVTMGLLVHELTTNALKYGALATPSGKIRVQWG